MPPRIADGNIRSLISFPGVVPAARAVDPRCVDWSKAYLASVRLPPDCRIGGSACRRTFRLSRSVSTRMCYISARFARRLGEGEGAMGSKLGQTYPRSLPHRPAIDLLLKIVAVRASLYYRFTHFSDHFLNGTSPIGCPGWSRIWSGSISAKVAILCLLRAIALCNCGISCGCT